MSARLRVLSGSVLTLFSKIVICSSVKAFPTSFLICELLLAPCRTKCIQFFARSANVKVLALLA